MFNLTDEQKVAALTLDRPIVVTAAAGSGKTTVLVARYLELLKTGLLPHQILTVTFTTEAAEQLRERIMRAVEQDSSLFHLSTDILRSRFIGTIHSFCYFLLSEYGSLLELPPIEEIISDYQFQVKLESKFNAWTNGIDSQTLSQIIAFVPRFELRSLFKHFFENRNSLKQFHLNASSGSPLDFCFKSAWPFLKGLQDELYQSGQFRFDDLEQLSLRLLKENAKFLSRLQTQFQSFLIDEFQDTSKNQWELFRYLVGNEFKKLFVVGDPKQSIYSFRHADVSLFFEVSRLTQQWGGLVTEMNTNFRSQAKLIANINQYSEQFFRDSSIAFQPMVCGSSNSGDSIRTIVYETTDIKDKKQAELTAVVSQVEAFLNSQEKPGELALLFRMGDRIETYTNELKRRGIPVESTQTLSLFSHLDILNLGHYFKALNNPKDSFSLSAFLNSPWVNIPLAELANLRDAVSDKPFDQRCQEVLGEKLAWFFNLSVRPHIMIREALFQLFENTQYFPQQQDAFMEWLKPLTERPYSLKEALNDLELWKREGIIFKAKSKDSEQGTVKLMTVHASKGLEFDHVFLVDNLRKPPSHSPVLLNSSHSASGFKYRSGLETCFTPEYESLKATKEKLDYEESRRILYVALTRAKTSLTLFLPAETKGIPQGSWAALLNL